MHSHTSIQYLVKRAEELAQRREKKDIRPEWLSEFIHQTADLFEPATDAARVGYDCRFDTNQWNILFYLGEAEIFGGMDDGKRTRIPFDFDLNEFLDRFETVEAVRYRVLPEDDQRDYSEETTVIEVSGILENAEKSQQVTVGILSHPPLAAGPGVKILPNGEIEPV